jgi:hypothetical protein
MSYVKNNHLSEYLPLNNTFLFRAGKKYRIIIEEVTIKYPVRGVALTGCLEEINCENEYKYVCLNNYDSFELYTKSLSNCLERIKQFA